MTGWTTLCRGFYVYKFKEIPYCNLRICTTPLASCIDLNPYCDIATLNGGCYDDDHDARIYWQSNCPKSCGTCYGYTIRPTYSPTIFTSLPTGNPTRLPTLMPSISPTCTDHAEFCSTVASACNSTDPSTATKMRDGCAATCGFCTSQPTEAPSEYPSVGTTLNPSLPCVDGFAYCADLALAGGCYNQDSDARLHFLHDCPLSCNTCFNRTVNPTGKPTNLPTSPPTAPSFSPTVEPSLKPSSDPTTTPTSAPTCVDQIGCCSILKKYCNTSSTTILPKLVMDCPLTCGFCTLLPITSPTISPSVPCADRFTYCGDLALAGGCRNKDIDARMHFQNDCPVSCKTCFNSTMTPRKSQRWFRPMPQLPRLYGPH